MAGRNRKCYRLQSAREKKMKLFWSTCPKCLKAFVVGWELRYAKVKLICPFCNHRYLPDESASIDERGGGQ